MIYLVAGDSASTLTIPCVDADGVTPLDLTGTTVNLQFSVDGAAVQQRNMTVSSPATAGIANYTPTGTDFPVAGGVQYQVQIAYPSGAVLTSRMRDDIVVEQGLI